MGFITFSGDLDVLEGLVKALPGSKKKGSVPAKNDPVAFLVQKNQQIEPDVVLKILAEQVIQALGHTPIVFCLQ